MGGVRVYRVVLGWSCEREAYVCIGSFKAGAGRKREVYVCIGSFKAGAVREKERGIRVYRVV